MSTDKTCGFQQCAEGFRRCWRFILCHRPHTCPAQQFDVLCLGKSHAGKSTILASLVGETLTKVEPTTGFNIKTLPIDNYILSIKEIGGSDYVRIFWKYYYREKHALVYVVDISATETQIIQTIELMRGILPNFRYKPLLIIGTNKDSRNARSDEQMEVMITTLLAGNMTGNRWVYRSLMSHDKERVREVISTLGPLMK